MENIIAVLKNKDVMKKIGFTLFAFFVYKAATYIHIPYINPEEIAAFFEAADSGFLGIANAFTGNALKNYSIIALGIGPYITASIVVQLLQMDIVPFLKEWSEEGETGKQKINQLTRYLAIALAFIQALAMTYGFRLTGNSIFDLGVDANFLTYTYLAIVMTAGSAFLLWLADQITLKGIGNGTSMIIVAGIVSGMPGMVSSLIGEYITAIDADWGSYGIFAFVMLLYFVVIFGVTIMQSANRKIPIQYSNRPSSSKFQGKSDSNIPLKINSAGVIPVIFAVTLLSLPSTVLNFASDSVVESNFGLLMSEMFDYTRPLGYLVYILLIFIFALFYSFVQINPEKIANNLQKQNAYVPGVRPGIDTENFISRLLFKITLIGATYLVVVASLPIFASIIFDLPAYVQIGGTSLLIVVGVAIETTKQIKTDTQDQKYSGFIK
ncbi:MAG: preprotein translocase subunit SecY [Candidatus Izemoplasma sp.]